MSNKKFNFTGMKSMLKFIVFILICLVTHETEAQVFIKPNNSYGLEYNRIKLDSAAVIPSDTVHNKLVGSIAILNDVFYIKNIFSWDALALAGSGGGSGSPLTWENVLDNGSDFSHSHLSNGNTNDLYFNNYGIFTINSNQFAVPYLGGGDATAQFLTTDAAGNFHLQALPIAVDSSGTTFGNQDLQDVIDRGNRLRHNNTIHSSGHDLYIDSLGNYSTFSGKTATFDNQTGAYTEIHQDSANAYLYSQSYTGLNISEVRTHQDSAHFQSYDSLGHNARFTAFGKGTLNSYASVADSLNSPKIVFGHANYKNSDTSKVLSTNSNGDLIFLTKGFGDVVSTGDVTWSVIDIVNTPPGSPASGDTYLVGTAGTGAFSGHNNQIATWGGSSWTFASATTGDLLQDDANSIIFKFNGTSWIQVGKAPWLIGLNAGITNPKFGTSNNTGMGIYTNNTQRLGIGNTGAFTFNSLSGTGNALMGLSSTGLASRVTPSWDTTNVSNVLSYGADSTGVVDATSAFYNAINASTLNGKFRVYIPHGTYKITVAALKSGSQTNKQGIQLVNNIEIFGDGVGKTTIKAAAQATGDTSTVNWYPVFNGFTGSISNVKIHDLSVNGNQANMNIYSANPYTNPTGHNDTSKHYSVQGIYFKDGDNDEVYRVKIDSCQGFGVEAYDATNVNIHHSVFTTNGNGGVGYTSNAGARSATGTISYCLVTNNNSDNIRILNQNGRVNVLYNELSYSQSNASATNWFAGVYVLGTNNIVIKGNVVHDNSAYGIDVGGPDSTSIAGMEITENYVFRNGNGGISSAGGYSTISNNWIYKNGKTTAGNTDTKSNYNPAAIVVNSSPHMVITGNHAYDTTSGVQANFIKAWGGGVAFPMRESVVTSNWVRDIADTSKFFGGTSGVGYQNVFDNNQARTSSDVIIPMAADTAIRAMAGGVEQWIPKWASSGGSSTPSLTSTQVAFGDGSNLMTSSSNLTYSSNAISSLTTGVGTSLTTSGLLLSNTSAATSGGQQYSQAIILGANGWKTNATAGTQPVKGYIQMRATQSTANPIGKLSFGAETNGFGISNTFSVSSNGVAVLQGSAGATLNVNGSAGIGMVHDETSGLQSTSVLELGTQFGNTILNLLLSTAALTTTSGSGGAGITMQPSMSVDNPSNTSTWYGANITMQNARSAATTMPALTVGVKGAILWGATSTSVDMPLAYGMWGNINLNASVTKNITTAYGLYSSLTSAGGSPTGKIGTWTGLRIDSADNNFYSTAAVGISQRGTNSTNFFAGNTMIGYGGLTGVAPFASAAFEINSTTQGFLPPVMTTTQKNAISSPAEGLIVYDVSLHKSYEWDGSAWQALF